MMEVPRRYRFVARRLEQSARGRRLLAFIYRHSRGFTALEILAVAVMLALVVRTFVVQSFRIPSESMHPTLMVGDQILVWKFWYDFQEPEVGDMVVFEPPPIIYRSEAPHYIKRIVAPPGSSLELIREPGDTPGFGHVYLDGRPVETGPFIPDNAYAMFVTGPGPSDYVRFEQAQVPAGEVYVFGDNTLASSDSRLWGGVPVENLEGKAFFRFWPLSRFGPLD